MSLTHEKKKPSAVMCSGGPRATFVSMLHVTNLANPAFLGS